jgi:tetratricopeptide (TPR) repeat protein
VDWLRTWLIDTFVTDVGELNTAPETAGAPATVVRALEDRYLLRGEAPAAGSGERRYQLLSARLVEPLRGNVGVTPETESVIVDIGDANPDEHLREAERARVMGEHDLANKIAAQVLRTVPGKDLRRHAEAHSLIGDVAYERGRLDEAESSYRTAISLFQACGQNAAVGRLFAAVARTFIDRGRLGEALDELAAAVNRVPDLILQDELVNVMTRLSEESARKPPFGPSAP